jgi:hypothetical protein
VGQVPERRACGLRKLARKRHTESISESVASFDDQSTRQAPRSPHFEWMGVRRVSIPFSVKWLKSSSTHSGE